MRTLIIGDVHGCKDELEDLVEQFGFVYGTDRLFQTGDMITRGPDTLGALEFAKDLGIRHVLGNQEARLLQTIATGAKLRKKRDWDFLNRMKGFEKEIVQHIRNWPVWIEEDDFFLVHAGFQPDVEHPTEMNPHVMLHVRTWDGQGVDMNNPQNPAWFEFGPWHKTVVFGHWAERGLYLAEGFRGIDTGCVYGESLTGWCPEEDRIYQVPARKNYVEIGTQFQTPAFFANSIG